MEIFGKKNHGPCALTIGNFDGVHLGHQSLVEDLKMTKLRRCALSFDPHPSDFFGQGKPLLMTLSQRVQCLLDAGIETVCIKNFDYEFAQLEAESFYHNFLKRSFDFKYLIVGHDFRFGQGRRGDYKMLKSLCDIDQIPCKQISQFQMQGQGVSSSQIRAHLQQGDIQQANVLLGKPYTLSGIVVHGDKKGRLLGFPTANFGEVHQLCPAHGVYVARIKIDDDAYRNCVVNIGVRPTLTQHLERRIEAHILNFSDSIYAKKVTLQFLARLRNELKFPNLEALKEQIALDVLSAERFFGVR